MNNDNKKNKNDTNSSYLIDEADENTGSVKHPKESHLTPNTQLDLPESQVPDTGGYDSPYLHPVAEVQTASTVESTSQSVNLSELKDNSVSSFSAANPTLNTPVINSASVQSQTPGTLPLSNPYAIPQSSNPEVIPVQPINKTEYVQVAKVKKGGGILGYLLMKIFNCVGCLLLLFSLVIVAFIVWIINF